MYVSGIWCQQWLWDIIRVIKFVHNFLWFCGAVPIVTLFTYAKMAGFDFRATNHCLNAEPWPYRTQAHFLRLFFGKKVHLMSHQICYVYHNIIKEKIVPSLKEGRYREWCAISQLMHHVNTGPASCHPHLSPQECTYIAHSCFDSSVCFLPRHLPNKKNLNTWILMLFQLLSTHV